MHEVSEIGDDSIFAHRTAPDHESWSGRQTTECNPVTAAGHGVLVSCWMNGRIDGD